MAFTLPAVPPRSHRCRRGSTPGARASSSAVADCPTFRQAEEQRFADDAAVEARLAAITGTNVRTTTRPLPATDAEEAVVRPPPPPQSRGATGFASRRRQVPHAGLPVPSPSHPQLAVSMMKERLTALEDLDAKQDATRSAEATQGQEFVARRIIVGAEAEARRIITVQLWTAGLSEAHLSHRLRMSSSESNAREAVIDDEEAAFDLIVDCYARQSAAFRRRLDNAAAVEDRAAALAARAQYFPSAVHNRQRATLLPADPTPLLGDGGVLSPTLYGGSVSEGDTAAWSSSASASSPTFFVVPRAALRAAAVADTHALTCDETAARRVAEAAWVDGLSTLASAFTSLIEASVR